MKNVNNNNITKIWYIRLLSLDLDLDPLRSENDTKVQIYIYTVEHSHIKKKTKIMRDVQQNSPKIRLA